MDWTLLALSLVFGLFDLVTYPIYWLLHQPWSRVADKDRKRAKVTRVDKRKVKHQHDFKGDLNKAVQFMGGPDVSIPDALDWTCAQYGDKDCMGSRRILGYVDDEFNGRPVKKVSKADHYDCMTFAEMREETNVLASGIVEMFGIRSGDKVLIFGQSSQEWLLTAISCFKAHCVVATLVPSMTDDIVEFGLIQTMPRVVFADNETLGRVSKIVKDNEKLQDVKIVAMSGADDITSEVTSLKDIKDKGAGRQYCCITGSIQPTNPAVIMYTSGTTSIAKGVVLTHRQVVEGMRGYTFFSQCFSPQPPHKNLRFLTFLPLSHIYALVVNLHVLMDGNCLLFGSPFTLTDASPLVPQGERGDLSVGKPHYMIVIPLILQRLKDGIEKKIASRGPNVTKLFNFCVAYKTKWTERGFKTPILDKLVFGKLKQVLGGHLSHVISGGAPLTKELHAFCRSALCTVVVQGYGATETAGLALCQDKETFETETAGYPPINGFAMLESWEEAGYHVDDKEGPAGEIVLCGPNIANGYFKVDSAEDNSSFYEDKEGNRCFRTGDIGRINLRTNSLSIVDRKKQLIKLQNAEYVSLGRIESVLSGSKYVEMACVLARSSKNGVVALIIPDKKNCHDLLNQNVNGAITEEISATTIDAEFLHKQLQVELKGKLTRYELPRAVTLVQGPWTPETGLVTGALKIKRNAIEQAYKDVVERMFASFP